MKLPAPLALLLLLPAVAAAAPPSLVPLPADDVKSRVAALDPARYPGADAVYLFAGTDVTVQDTGKATRIEHRIVACLTLAGCTARQTLRFDYDPLSNRIAIDHVRIYRRNGSIEDVDPAAALDLPQPMHGLYWTFRMKILPLPSLLPGDAVSWQSTFTGFQIAYLDDPDADDPFVPPQRGEFYDVVLLASDLPAAETVYHLSLPLDKPVYYQTFNRPVSARARALPDALSYTFWTEDTPALPAEPQAPQATEIAPKVVLSTLPDWKGRSTWFYMVNEPSFHYSPEIRQMALEIVAGADSDLEKARRLNRWVAHNIRYSGLSMGKGEGYTLHPGTMTWTDRCGVCKDKAGMLVTMMRAVGFTDTFAAMTMAGATVENVPADQFNHAVVAWRQPDGSFILLDPTWAPLSRQLWSNAEAEQDYLIGTPQGEPLRRTPPLPPGENRLDVSVRSTLSPDGRWESALSVTATGALEDNLRRTFGGRPVADWQAVVAAMAAQFSPAATAAPLDLSLDTVMDLDQPFAISFTFAANAAVPSVRTDRYALLPAAFALPVNDPRSSENLLAAPAANRKTGLFFRCAKEIRYTEEIRLPDKAEIIYAPAVDVANELGAVQAAVSLSGSTARVQVLLRFNTRRIPADKLALYQELLDAVASFRNTRIILRRIP